MRELTDKLCADKTLTKREFVRLLSTQDGDEYLLEKSRERALSVFGNKIYIRGLIEISSFCRNNCYYCGIRRDNKAAERYRLSHDEIMECCRTGYELGFRTFVLQGGEDAYFNDEVMCGIVADIRGKYPDCAITLSLGERSRTSYKRLFDAGADRYLLRHETANSEHYAKLHPAALSLANRMRCLADLKEIGYQVGSGFMVGSPYQTTENLAEDLLYLKRLKPNMIGMGPFLPHKDTPFGAERAGDLNTVIRLIAILRLMFPHALIPATTALGTLNAEGRERGILAGANVVMPNLSPADVRKKYLLYNNKIATDCEAAEGISRLRERLAAIGYEIEIGRGDNFCID